jgi:hypothetical protein
VDGAVDHPDNATAQTVHARAVLAAGVTTVTRLGSSRVAGDLGGEAHGSTSTEEFMPQPKQPVTDDSIQVRQLSHYQFTWIAGEPGAAGTWTLQLVLDQGAWEEVLTVDPDDADNLQDMLSAASVVHYDVRRRTLMFGTTPVGSA